MLARRGALCAVLIAACSSVACSDEVKPRIVMDEDAGAATGDGARPAFCAHDADDAVHDAFCNGHPPVITGIADLQELFAFLPDDDAPTNTIGASDAIPDPQLTTVAVLGHSTALSGHLVSPINPRVIMMGNTTFMAFQRGEQRVELITRTADHAGLDFYLVSFEQACNEAESGCGPGDLYTPAIESDWLRVHIDDGEQLENTSADCRVCHQRASDSPTLLMRELEAPWTHFFFPPGISSSAPGITGSNLAEDYLLAKDDEPYAGLPLRMISAVSPFLLQSLVGSQQPLLFDAPRIENERYPYGPDGYPKAPNPSPTWQSAYEAWKRGEQLALPYVEQRVADPDKQAKLSAAYLSYMQNEISADELPDLSDIFPDDPHERAQRGLQTEPDATPEDALIQACGSCHNDVLDQDISRARFNIAVSRLDREELDLAIDRIQRPHGADGAMPPHEVRQLDPTARDRLIEYLEQEPSALDPDGRLEQVSRGGITGGSGVHYTGGEL